MRLLLTHGYFLAEDAKERSIMKPYPPLGILYLSSHLKARGFDSEIYDSTFGSRQELFSILDSAPAGVAGIYANLMTRASVLSILERAKASGWLVMLGGPEPANYAEEFLSAGADLIVTGEGERAVEMLARANFDRDTWPSIPGLVFRSENGGLVRTGAADLIRDLDAQPWPDREQIDVERYLSAWRARHGVGSVSVITARGCPYKCSWCSHSVYGHTHRRRSPTAVVDEIEWLIGRYSPEMLWIADDVFTIHHGWLNEYAAEMKRRGIAIPFECITRADRVNPSVAATLAGLACRRVWIGSESGSQKILDAMQRGVTAQQVRTAVALCKANGIETGMFLMWGYDGEQMEDIDTTIDHVRSCRPDVFLTTVSYPIKGTPYFDRVSAKLVSIGDWKESSDRDFKIRGRHSRRFYQYADELLRAEMSSDQVRVLAARRALEGAMDEVEA
ncbi:MAG TPA: radical SAM protein [Bryobacteraceae bacterium]|nr:radical SAM protein [Bryobacteraceae bacterium]